MRHRTEFAILAAFGTASTGFSSVARAANLANIRISSERTVLWADGLSTTVITAQVYDDRGNPAPDRVRVRFTTTAGRLDASVAVTQSGSARVTLTAADQPGDAMVTAILETAGTSIPQNVTISFSRDADTAETGSAWVRVSGDYVAYAMDYTTIQANGRNGGAKVTYRGLTLSADSLQVDVQANQIRARDNVVLSRGGVTRSYTNLRFDLLQGQGVAERVVDGRLQTVVVGGATLTEVPPPPGSPRYGADQWALADLSGAGVTVVARSLALEPNRRLQFRRATFYLDGQKTVSFPFHVMSLGQKTLFEDQLIGIGPSGPSIDLPVYYDVRPTDIGTLHIRHGARIGSSAYSVRPGWSLDLSQAYNGAHSVEGVVDVYGLTRGGWNAQIRHGQRLDPRTTGSLYLDTSAFNNVFLTTQATRTYKLFQLNATASGTRAGGLADPVTHLKADPASALRGQLNAQTYSRPVFGIKQLQYSFTADVSRQGFQGNGVGVPQGIVDTEGAGTRFFTTPLPLARGTSLSQSVNIGNQWVQGSAARKYGLAASGTSVYGTTTLNQMLGRLGSTSLSYDYAAVPQILTSGIATTSSGIGRHRLGFGLSLAAAEAWNVNLSGSRGIDVPTSTLYSTIGFRIAGPWRGGVVVNLNSIGGITYRDLEYRLSRRIASRDISVYYSTTAKRLQFDLSTVGF